MILSANRCILAEGGASMLMGQTTPNSRRLPGLGPAVRERCPAPPRLMVDKTYCTIKSPVPWSRETASGSLPERTCGVESIQECFEHDYLSFCERWIDGRRVPWCRPSYSSGLD